MFGGLGDILFFAIVAVAVGYKLFMVLGHRDFGSSDSEEAKKKRAERAEILANNNAKLKDVTNLAEKKPDILPSIEQEEKALVDFGVEHAKAIEQIKEEDPSFSVRKFLDGAAVAFEMVLKAFAQGDRETLKYLLSPVLYQGFERGIIAREQQGNIHQTTLLAAPEIKIKSVQVDDVLVRISLAYSSEQIDVIKNRDGEVVEGDPVKSIRAEDIWCFERKLKARDPNWVLVSTAAE
jgi:predicted lipid-binding transport protein (Tim44 family)